MVEDAPGVLNLGFEGFRAQAAKAAKACTCRIQLAQQVSIRNRKIDQLWLVLIADDVSALHSVALGRPTFFERLLFCFVHVYGKVS